MTPLQRLLLRWYERHGRSRLPWRTVRTAYYTLVSEFMLQQTQVERVLPKFEAFVARYPDIRALAAAPLGDVIRQWKGLGYNSRALRLVTCARVVVERHAGEIPRDETLLRELPGVGSYTAAAIRAFAFNEKAAAIDTNVRRIVHRVHFGLEHPRSTSPAQIDRQALADVPVGRAHDWNSAMMDLGAALCTARAPKCTICPVRGLCAAAPIDAEALETARKRHAKRPSPQQAQAFRETTRYARGRIVDRLRDLSPGERISMLDLHRDLHELLPARKVEDIARLAQGLQNDGLVVVEGAQLALKE